MTKEKKIKKTDKAINLHTPIEQQCLTKKYFISLSEGLHLVSNIGSENITSRKISPIFTERVSKMADRQKQWERIKKAGADQRSCRIFKTGHQSEAWVDRFFVK